jgi:hypothetical protein
LRKDSSSLVQKELAGELMILDRKTKKASCLNPAAAFVWRHCDGETSIEELARLLSQETGAPAETRVIEYALRSLEKEGLMERANLTENEYAFLGRRQLFLKLGWAAALAVAVPVVLTVTAPKAQAFY